MKDIAHGPGPADQKSVLIFCPTDTNNRKSGFVWIHGVQNFYCFLSSLFTGSSDKR